MRRALRREDALGRNCSLPEDAPDGFLKSCIWLSSRMGMMKSKRKILLLTGVHSQNEDNNSCSIATAQQMKKTQISTHWSFQTIYNWTRLYLGFECLSV